MRCILIACAIFGALHGTSWARGASPYLPLNLAPEMERQIERVMILADRPVMSRPIPAAAVLDALPAACRIDEALCRSVRRYLDRYMDKVGVPHASVEGGAADDIAVPLPNRHGMSSDGNWGASLRAYWQPSDYMIVSLGGIGYEGELVPSGSFLSIGFEYAQLDVGYRDHWFSPFTDSAMIISTQARTLPSITLSNYKPMTRFGLQYEVFLAEMDRSDRIAFQDRLTSGNPRLAGLRFALAPAVGWTLGANRMVQFAGGERGGTSFGDFIDALIDPSGTDNRSPTLTQEEEFGNQVAAWTSRFIFPGATPFSVYFEYAGEDTSYSTNHRLGNAALSIGVTWPHLWRGIDLTYEGSEWQNGWYVHGIFLDGLTVDGRVLGHWGANARLPGDSVGAQSHMLRIGWEPHFGGLFQVRARTVANEDYGTVQYDRGYDLTVSFSRAFGEFTGGAELIGGRDVFGDSFGRVTGFVRFGADWSGSSASAPYQRERRERGAELFVDAGLNVNRLDIRFDDGGFETKKSTEIAPRAAIGARRAVSSRSDLGVRLELDSVDGKMLVGVRALDYRYRFRGPLAMSVFAGAARYDAATPTYGYYFGAGLQWRDLLPRIDLGVDLRYADKLARDKLLPSDPPAAPRPDIFYDVTSATMSLSYRF